MNVHVFNKTCVKWRHRMLHFRSFSVRRFKNILSNVYSVFCKQSFIEFYFNNYRIDVDPAVRLIASRVPTIFTLTSTIILQ